MTTPARKRSKPAAKTWPPPSAWLNDDTPELGPLVKPHGIDVQEFSGWLGRRLAIYRMAVEVRPNRPKPAERAEAMGEVRELARTLIAALRGLLEIDAMWLRDEVSKRSGIPWDDPRGRIVADLRVLASSAARVEQGTRPKLPAKRGPKPLIDRDMLIADTAEKLQSLAPELDVTLSRVVAHKILLAAGIPVPDPEDRDKPGDTTRPARRGRQN